MFHISELLKGRRCRLTLYFFFIFLFWACFLSFHKKPSRGNKYCPICTYGVKLLHSFNFFFTDLNREKLKCVFFLFFFSYCTTYYVLYCCSYTDLSNLFVLQITAFSKKNKPDFQNSPCLIANISYSNKAKCHIYKLLKTCITFFPPIHVSNSKRLNLISLN